MRHKIVFSICLGLWLAAQLATVRAIADERATFVLQDFLRREWSNEVVRFAVTADQLQDAETLALVDASSRSLPFQIDTTKEAEPRIVFQASLQPLARQEYRLTAGQRNHVTDLVIEEDQDYLRLLNSHTGVLLRKQLKDGQGPLAGVRLKSGKWVGDSRLKTGLKLLSYTVERKAQGPVYSEIACRAQLEGDHFWELRVRLEANEPVAIVEEEFSLGNQSAFSISLSNSDFAPDHLLYRNFLANGPLTSEKIGPGPENVFNWEPWLHWWGARHGTWFGLYNEAGPDLLSIAACNPGIWVDAAPPRTPKVLIPLKQDGAELNLTLPLDAGKRRWIVCSLSKDPSLAMLSETDLHQAPPPQEYLIKHGNFPLDLVKDYVLQWPGDETDHPRLLITQEQVARVRAKFKPDPAILESLRTAPFSQYAMNQQVHYYVGTGDEKLGQHLAETAQTWVQQTVDMLVGQDRIGSLGFAPHQQTEILSSLNLADVVWSTQFSPAERERIKAQVAFIAYTVQRPDYWAPEKGFSANPNMTTSVAAFQLVTAAAIPSHPLAKAWMTRALHEFKDTQLDTWADSNGGWLEAPHYAMVSYDYLVGAFIMTRNAQLNDHLYDPKMKKISEWFAKISTPPDSRCLNWRHLPPIGNTLLSEPTGEFAILAALWKDKDPEFAANMQWMHEQQGSFGEPGPGGFFPMLCGYRTLLVNPSIVHKAPSYQSELFPETGALLRTHFPSERETQLHLIAGRNHDHYDQDSGSITIWGKGRIVADDFGYQGHMPPDDHSMVETRSRASIMQVREFNAGPQLDYVRGEKSSWQRQIALVKDSDPLGLNYFVLRDSLSRPQPAIWRLWLAASEVKLDTRGATALGTEDVDTDIFFVTPSQVNATVETKSRKTSGFDEKGVFGGDVTRTQLGLIVPLQDADAIMTVIHPRLKTDKAPVLTTLAEGKGVKVESPVGVDYVFLSDAPFKYNEGDVAFEGTVGGIQLRDGKPRLSLGAKGRIAFGKEEYTK